MTLPSRGRATLLIARDDESRTHPAQSNVKRIANAAVRVNVGRITDVTFRFFSPALPSPVSYRIIEESINERIVNAFAATRAEIAALAKFRERPGVGRLTKRDISRPLSLASSSRSISFPLASPHDEEERTDLTLLS